MRTGGVQNTAVQATTNAKIAKQTNVEYSYAREGEGRLRVG